MGKFVRSPLAAALVAGFIAACANDVPPTIDDRADSALATITRHPSRALCGDAAPGHRAASRTSG